MKAEELLREGRLQEAIDAVGAGLRDNPGDIRNRTFLFELLCFTGEHERAEKHLSLLEQESKEAVLGTLLYRGALNAEKTRTHMFEKKEFPSTKAEDGVRGALNGKEFSSLSDADPRIGARLELFAAGDYMWISFADIAIVEIDPPKRLRDLLWTPARLKTGPTFRGKDLGEVLVPVLSPLSFQHSDDAVRLGRVTEWCQEESGEEAPFGHKMLLVDGEEVPLLEIRKLEIFPPEAVET